MKKLHSVSFLLSLIITISAGAQINKGAVLLGGSLSGYSQRTEQQGGSEFTDKLVNVSPTVGIAIRQNLVAGISATYAWRKIQYEDPTDVVNKGNSYGASFFLRKYKTLGKSGFALFVQGDLGAATGKLEGDNGINRTQTKKTDIFLSAYPGVSLAISRKLQLETGFNNLLFINWTKERNDNLVGGNWQKDTETTRMQLSTSLNNFTSSLYLGFRVLLNKG
jgi:hypothetical protein